MNKRSSSNSLDVTELFPFSLDRFQEDAIAALNTGKSVVVCVPTGSGKTLVGEYAIYHALEDGKRVFYTTPLKALSNQKFRDFRDLFGPDRVGILTGDASINRQAPILVMTTEIFRNMLYGTPIGQVGTSLEGVETVVLDECHYMNDSQRGTVWEESIIYCPHKIKLAALSATVANAAELADWIGQVHGETRLIQSNFRPVPLEFHFSTIKGLFPLLDGKKKRMNPQLKPKGRGKRGGRQRVRREDCPSIGQVVTQLSEKKMLPAIYFIFSRKGCDRAVEQMGNFELVTPAEAAELERRIEEFLAANPNAGRTGQVEPLARGIAAHHAGILPAWKGLVEELFQLGLVKVVFATETLAAGINMPARTTVISAISKRTDIGHRLLTASEFLQMAGRAGRRGMDEQGYVVTVQTRFEGAKDAAKLALKPADPLVSRFTPTYGMVLNLLQTHTIQQAKELLERSFAQYTATLKLEPEKRAIAELTTELAKLDIELAHINEKQFSHYEKLKERRKEERRLLKSLQQQAEHTQRQNIAQALVEMTIGQVLYLKGRHVRVSHPLPAVLFAEAPGSGQLPYYVCLSAENRWYVVSSSDVIALDQTTLPQSLINSIFPPEDLPIQLGQQRKGDESSANLAKLLPETPEKGFAAPEVLEQQKRLEAVEEQLDNHPLNEFGKPGKLIKRHKHRLSLRQELRDRQENYKEHQTHHWREFMNLVKMLREFAALEDYTPTALGQGAAAIRGDNELWLGLAFLSGELDNLDPQDLAAVAYALISDPPRPDSWTNYLPPEGALIAIAQLQPIRKQLIQRQYRYKIAIPVWLEEENLDLLGIIQRWALGVEWEELCENTSFDEGDLVRMLRRTIDLLSQIPHVPNVSDTLVKNARRALQLMERFPVKEMVE
ncbi:DEAD/DEAH box helicase [Spirulina sp. CS-785/01]|uniref:DEAD/DEAH box helicase n=1 Tax=Spirulina sp. CS-785/01 TaxID=3021716 RepID=UPI002330189C|nr:DEAD/DEAH box helicase [Spirulina sp. CS-785/01]MDB9312467.1 DEAD/DEAH box helicase [Spirulina sp. CS-785/01]